jgi:midasin
VSPVSAVSAVPASPYNQGPTSSGKTSLVGYLAAQTGHKFVRINNHQHTDLQEYLGSWVPDEQGEGG